MSYLKNGDFEYGIEFTCDCFPKSRFSEEYAGMRTSVNAKASFSKPIYSRIAFKATQGCSFFLRGLLDILHWLDGHKMTVQLSRASQLDREIMEKLSKKS